MLDAFLEVAYEYEKRASDYRALVQDMLKLPKEELKALADGTSKLAFCDGPESDSWLDKFKDTPLHEQALALEQQSLELDIAREQRRLADSQKREAERPQEDDEYRQQDAIRLKKRILDLELNKMKLQGAGGAVEEGAPPPAPAAGAPEPVVGAPVEGPEKVGHKTITYPVPAEVLERMKVAAELTTAAREHIKPKNFALTPKQSDTGKPAYPIEDKRHAANALSRVKQFGSPKEKAEVYKDVAKKYPGLAEHSSVPSVKAKAEKDACMEGKTAGATPEQVANMKKQALSLGALKPAFQVAGQGLKGALGYGRQAANVVGGVVKREGLGQGLGALGRQAATGVTRAGEWAAQNPAAAGLLGAGALGAGALGTLGAAKAVHGATG